MKIEIIEETKEKIKFKLYNSRYTIPEMLKKQLLTHKEVTMASGMLKHPEDKDSEFVLIVKNADAKKVLINAIEELQTEIKSFKDGMLKVLPEDSKTKSKSESKKKTKA